MKKVFILPVLLFCLLSASVVAQGVKGTVADEGSNTIGIYGSPSSSLTGVLFRNINVTFSIADQGAGNPSNAQVLAASDVPNLDIQPVTTFGGNPYVPGDGRAYYSYIMSDNGVTTTSTWPAGTKNNKIAHFTFPSNSYFATLRMDDLSPSGGPNLQMYWYVEVIGPGDVTDYSTMFYGTALIPPTNNGGSSPSFVPLQPISVIPVRFLGFTAVKSGSDAILKWEVTNEDANVDRYELERSFNGTDFSSFATILKSSSTATTKTYNSTDANIAGRVAQGAIVYYRVRQVDRDGRSTYTEIRNIRFSNTKGFGVTVFPNPVKDVATVNIDLDAASAISILVTDAAGKELKRVDLDGAAGGNTKQINMSNFAAGTYVLRIKAGEETQLVKVVKK